MKVTVDGITYEGTEDEIRRIVENPPHRPPAHATRPIQITNWPPNWTWSGVSPEPVPLNLCEEIE